jgi:hypothetical protein
MKKYISLFLIFTISLYSAITITGCATLFSGSSEDVSLTSEPQGAKILVNGINEGKTPATLHFKKGKEYSIEFVKDGYESKSVRLGYSLGAGWLILDIFTTFFIGVIVDAVTGAWNGSDFNYYKANLEPKAESK